MKTWIKIFSFNQSYRVWNNCFSKFLLCTILGKDSVLITTHLHVGRVRDVKQNFLKVFQWSRLVPACFLSSFSCTSSWQAPRIFRFRSSAKLTLMTTPSQCWFKPFASILVLFLVEFLAKLGFICHARVSWSTKLIYVWTLNILETPSWQESGGFSLV